MTPDEFIASARTMLGVRFHHQGRNAEHGLDCAGLAVCAAANCGFQAIDYTTYHRQPETSDFLLTLAKNCDRIQRGNQQPGDLLIFEFDNNPQHLAIMTGPNSIIHAYSLVRRVVEHDLDDTWKAKLRAVFRIRGM
jgi:cell wall-associated NlpC family hydrolase